MECKKALVEAGGDVEEAQTLLRKKGVAIAQKKAGRATSEGQVGQYIHFGGKIGVLAEINCETDFVARNEDFQNFVREICLHIAAANPKYISRDEVPEELIAQERGIAEAQAEGKPPVAVQKIVEGKLDKFFSQICLLEQPYVKSENNQTVKQFLEEMVTKIGENLVIRRFARFQVGEE